MTKEVILNGSNLDINTVGLVAHNKTIKVSLSPEAQDKMKASRNYVLDVVKKGKPVYGINTGFGALSNVFIEDSKLEELQYNLIRSHCTGVGEEFTPSIVRAIMLLRANCLASGYSGITPEVVELILQFINHNIIPIVPSKGSVGASGDLAPLSHIALALIGEGEVLYDGKRVNSSFAIDQIGMKPAKLGAKDGLALINGTAVMAALGCLAICELRKLVKIADVTAALTLDGVKGTLRAFDPRISQLKGQKSQIDCCENLNILLKDSEIYKSHDNCDKVQDPYSLRCVPQVHGASRQTLKHAEEILQSEVNAVTDNPLIFYKDDDVISGGNFHGQAIALAMDYLAMGAAELCSISERRVEKMMNPTFSDLPAFLTADSGLNSGLMIAHVTSAALCSENKYLCHPASIDSVPTSTDKEDHVSMGVTSGRKLLTVIDNLKNCLSIELLCNTQALDFQRPLKTTEPLEAVHKLIRKHVHKIEKDRAFYKDIESIIKVINTDELLNVVENITGELK